MNSGQYPRLTRALIASSVALVAARGAHASLADQIFLDGFDGNDYCPVGRVASTKVGWRYDGAGQVTLDVTQAKNVWGRNSGQATPVDMPWLQEFAVFWTFPREGYLAARFIVPTTLPAAQQGILTHGETLGGPRLDTSISPTCGDFYSGGPRCVTENVGIGDRAATWQLDTTTGSGCYLHPGDTYYLNVRISDPDVVSNQCNSSTCVFTLQSNHTP